MLNYRSLGYATLRVTIGMMFLVFGIQKFMAGASIIADGIIKEFAGKLPAVLVSPFAHVIPFAEVGIGALLVLGLFTEIGLVLAGLLMLALTFGMVIAGQGGIVANNIFYAFVIFVLLWLSNNDGANRYSIDGLLRRKH